MHSPDGSATPRSVRRALLAALGMLVAGCGSGNAPSARPPSRSVETQTVAFGPVLVGTRVERTLEANEALALAGASEAGPYSFEMPGMGAATVLVIAFTPTRDGEAAADVTLLRGERKRPSVLHLRGTAVASCPGEAVTLEFPAVAVGEAAVVSAVLKNPARSPWEVSIAAIDSPLFALAPGFVPGARVVPAGPEGVLSIPVQFRPAIHGEASAAWTLPAPAGCPERDVRLTGFGVSRGLTCEPVELVSGRPVCTVGFDSVVPSASAAGRLTFRNDGPAEVEMTLGDLAPHGEPAAAFARVSPSRTIRIPAGGAAVVLEFAFVPPSPGWHQATLPFTTTLPEYPAGTVALRGAGIGPKIRVTPPLLDFETLGPAERLERSLVVWNEGAPGATEDEGLLRFAERRGGEWVPADPQIAGSEEFSVAWPRSGRLPDLAPGKSVRLAVEARPAGPGRKDATLRILTNDPSNPVLDVPLTATAVESTACELQVSPPSINFGLVESGETLQLPLTLTSRSAGPGSGCLLSGITVEPPPFALGTPPSPSLWLEGGSSRVIPVRFAPSSDGRFEGALQLVATSPTQPRAVVRLSGISSSLPVLVAPRNLDFGEVLQSCPSRRLHFGVSNLSSQTQYLESMDLLAGANSAFSFPGSPALPAAIPGAGTRDFSVQVLPTALGEQRDVALLKVAGYSGSIRVGLSARAVARTPVIDRWEQPPLQPLDVLLVIDDSPAMADKLASLARNLASFIRDAVQQKVDYHIAATTTSVGAPSWANGRLLPLSGTGPRVITPSTPSKEWVFLQNVDVGAAGSAVQKLLLPAQRALSEPLLSGENAGFYRPEAKLAVIAISAAADKDTSATADYESFLVGLKGVRRRNEVTFSAIVPTLAVAPDPASGCSYDSPAAGQSTRAKDLVWRTGGMLEEICNPDWARALRALGGASPGLRTTFFLSEAPDLKMAGPFLVRVDGVPFQQYGPDGQRWDYDSSGNAIVFDPLAVPGPGSALEIEYWPRCPGA